jgi:hypothetical protein
MAGLCLTSAILIMADAFLFTRHAAALEKCMVSVERLQQYTVIPQEPLSHVDRLMLPPNRGSKERGEVIKCRIS